MLVFLDNGLTEVWHHREMAMVPEAEHSAMVATDGTRMAPVPLRDPFEHYTENELDALLESTSAYMRMREALLGTLHRLRRLRRLLWGPFH